MMYGRHGWRVTLLGIIALGVAGFAGPATTGANFVDTHAETVTLGAATEFTHGECGNADLTLCDITASDGSSGPPGKPETRYDVTYDVSDPDGGQQFRNVTVVLLRDGSTIDTRTAQDESATVTVSQTGNNIGTAYTLVVRLGATSGATVECYETTDQAGGDDPAGFSTC